MNGATTNSFLSLLATGQEFQCPVIHRLQFGTYPDYFIENRAQKCTRSKAVEFTAVSLRGESISHRSVHFVRQPLTYSGGRGENV